MVINRASVAKLKVLGRVIFELFSATHPESAVHKKDHAQMTPKGLQKELHKLLRIVDSLCIE